MIKIFSLMVIIVASSFPLLSSAIEETPDLKITKFKLVEVGDTYLQLAFSANQEAYLNSSDDQHYTITYRRKSPEAKARSITELNAYYNYTSVTREDNYISINGFLADTEYIIRVKTYNDGRVTSSKKLTFKTAKVQPMKITGLSATTVSGGETLTIYGQGFGKQIGRVRVGYYGYDNESEILAWSKDQITVKLPDVMTDGPVEVEAFRSPAMRTIVYSQSAFSADINVLNESHIYQVEGICDRPGVIADSYEAIVNFNYLYQEGFGRSINCEELEFHLQHTTPHDRLKEWLAEQDLGMWWTNMKTEYDGQLFYDDHDIYWMSEGTLYGVGNMIVAASWGLLPDDAKYIAELFDSTDPLKDDYDDILRNAETLKLHDGPYYKKVLKMIRGQNVSFNNEELDDYYSNNLDLLTTQLDDNEEFTADICEYLQCGMVY